MAQGALDQHWSELAAGERNEFVSLFSAFIEAAYLTQIQDYVELNIPSARNDMPVQTTLGWTQL
jgi:ABC-type transporter MlaC component